MKPVNIGPFEGMNNMQGHEGDPKKPEVILNADNDSQGSLLARQGQVLSKSLPGAHSLWSNGMVTFVAAKGNLYRMEDDESLTSVASLGQDGPVGYATVMTDNEQSVYISAPDYLGRYDMQAQSMGQWGIEVPPSPRGSLVDGNLEPGVYKVCYTKHERGKMSAPGRVVTFDVPEGRGIFLANVAGYQAWITDPGGGELQRLGQVNMITDQPAGGEPLPSLDVAPPEPGLTCLWWAFGRMWAFKKNLLVYSEPYEPELFRPHSFMDFGRQGAMIAPVAGGFYASTDRETYFMQGTNPSEMRMIKAGNGALPGSLAYIKSLRDFGNNVPVWVGEQGIMAGNHDGMVVCLTTRKVKLTPNDGQQAGAVAREVNGELQYLTSYRRKPGGSGMGMGDSATAEVIRNGKVIST